MSNEIGYLRTALATLKRTLSASNEQFLRQRFKTIEDYSYNLGLIHGLEQALCILQERFTSGEEEQ